VGHSLRLRIAEGRLLYGYQDAASLRACDVAPADGGGFTLAAEVTHANTFRISRRPLVFVVSTARGVWRFPVVDLSLDASGTRLTARLGSREGSTTHAQPDPIRSA
jgi:hypothetical protein